MLDMLDMLELLWHGRGGQGAFTAARLLGAAYAHSGASRYGLAFPSFGPERRGAPVRAFTKLSRRPIGDRSEIEKADFVIYLDHTLFCQEAFEELKPNGKILLNSKEGYPDERVISIDGDALATEILGRPIANTAMLGAIAALAEEIALEDIITAIEGYMPEKLQQKNIALVTAAYHLLADGKHSK